MRREDNRWLGWKRITQSIRVFDESKMAAGAFGRARDCGCDGRKGATSNNGFLQRLNKRNETQERKRESKAEQDSVGIASRILERKRH